MAKFLVLLALAGVACANPMGGLGIGGIGGGLGYGGVGVSKQISHHSHVGVGGISPYYGLGLGYGMLGYPGLIGKTHLIAPLMVQKGLGLAELGGLGIKAGILAKGAGLGMVGLGQLGMLKGIGMYPGGIGLGYGLIG